MKYRPKHIAEYVFLRGVTVAVNLLPLRAALAVGWLIGRFFFSVLRYRRTKATARLEEVFSDRFSAKERRQIAWHSFRNLCFNAVEAARFQKLTPEKIRKMPLYAQMEQVQQFHREHGPLIFATAHMGNWDLAGVAGRLDGLPIFSIARRQKNPLTDSLLNKLRNATGMEVVLNDSRILQNVVRKLKAGNVLAILPDVRQKDSDIQVGFLNGKASLGAGAALFAQLAKCPILPVVITRKGWTRHEAKIFDPIFPDPAADKTGDRARIMQELLSVLDAEIQAHPEQYFWFNKRWVLDPPN
jgi:Kdo2-lipid IVA lauroyltransferase/acyltransferase